MEGSIRISTPVDTSGAKKGFADLERMAKHTGEVIEQIGDNLSFGELTEEETAKVEKAISKDVSAIDKTKAKIKDVQDEIKRLGNAFNEADHKGFEKYNNKIVDLERELEKAREKTEEAQNAWNRKYAEKRDEVINSPNAWQKARMQGKTPLEQHNFARDEALRNENVIALGAEVDKLAEKERNIEESLMRQKELRAGAISTALSTQQAQEQALTATLQQQTATLNEHRMTALQGVEKAREEASAKAKQEKIQERLNARQKRFNALMGAVSKLSGNITNLGKKMTKSIDGSVKSLKRFAMGLLGIRGLFMFVRQISQTIMANNETLKSQLDGIKNTIGVAFEPILYGIINSIVKVISYVNALITALSGVNLVAKANKKAINAVGGSAKQLQNQLAGFDEMNVLSDNSGGGGGAGAKSLELDDVSGEKFFQQLKDAMEKGDWNGVGRIVANKFNEAIDKIDWETIKGKVSKGVIGIADFINGFFADFDMKDFGKTIAEGFNTIILAIHDFIWNIDWATLGSQLANGLLGLIENIDVKQLWETFTGALFGAVEFLWNFVNTIFDELGISWSDFLSPKKFGKLIADGIKKIASALGAYLGDFLAEKLTGLGVWLGNLLDKISEFKDKVKEGVGKVTEWLTEKGTALQNFIIQFIVDIPNKIKKQINSVVDNVKQSIDNIKACFIMMKDGIKTLVIDPIKEWFNNAWNTIKKGAQGAWDGIKKVFSTVASFFQSTFQSAWKKVKDVFSTGGKIFDGIKDGIVTAFKSIVNGIISGINKVVATPFNTLNSVLNTIRNISILGSKPFANKIGNISVPRIPQLALGGVINQPTFAQIGEAGKEAVLPLTNKSIMEELGKAIGEFVNQGTAGDIIIPITLGNKEIARYTVQVNQRQAFATNGGKW